jgi:hypothetical protein
MAFCPDCRTAIDIEDEVEEGQMMDCLNCSLPNQERAQVASPRVGFPPAAGSVPHCNRQLLMRGYSPMMLQ